MAAYVKREIEPVLRECLGSFPAVVLTGPRQSGKTTLVRHLASDYRYISLDDPLLRSQAERDPELLLGEPGDRVILDEIQNVPGLLTRVKLRIDERRHVPGRFVITGSQQLAVMRGVTESLAGRTAILELLPFTLREAHSAHAESVSPSMVERFTQACLSGLYPEPVVLRGMAAERWQSAYVQTYIERDVRSIYDIGSLRDFERFLVILASRCSQTLNMTSLASDVGVAVNTIKRWISILEAGRIVYLLEPYYANLGKRLVRSPKLYFMDCGLVCYLTRVRDPEHLLHGPMAGPLFECLCVQEAVKACMNAGIPPRLSYLRTQHGLEVDLLVEGPNRTLVPFEFKAARTPRTDMAASIGKLQGLLGPERLADGYVVSLSERTDALTAHARLLPLDSLGQVVREVATQ